MVACAVALSRLVVIACVYCKVAPGELSFGMALFLDVAMFAAA